MPTVNSTIATLVLDVFAFLAVLGYASFESRHKFRKQRRALIEAALDRSIAPKGGGMQETVELLSELGDRINAIKSHISRMDDLVLEALAASLPSKAPPGTPEMLMLLLVYREMECRTERNQDNNVLQFPSVKADG